MVRMTKHLVSNSVIHRVLMFVCTNVEIILCIKYQVDAYCFDRCGSFNAYPCAYSYNNDNTVRDSSTFLLMVGNQLADWTFACSFLSLYAIQVPDS